MKAGRAAPSRLAIPSLSVLLPLHEHAAHTLDLAVLSGVDWPSIEMPNALRFQHGVDQAAATVAGRHAPDIDTETGEKAQAAGHRAAVGFFSLFGQQFSAAHMGGVIHSNVSTGDSQRSNSSALPTVFISTVLPNTYIAKLDNNTSTLELFNMIAIRFLGPLLKIVS